MNKKRNDLKKLAMKRLSRKEAGMKRVVISQHYLRMMSNFYIGANWMKGPSSAGIQVSVIISLQDFDEISTFFL